MADDTKELTKAIWELKTAVALNSAELKHQTEYMKEQFHNGFAQIIVNKVTKRFGIMVGTVGAILGIIMLFVI